MLLSFISCNLILNGELKDKSVNLPDKIYSTLETNKETIEMLLAKIKTILLKSQVVKALHQEIEKL
ncbi:hypothetical protein BHY_1569 (plasmid) [Borrelia nietonii YOR]|uniref:Uncharacterized protein n=2 Tax=Borrelia TaxID=138 RepID=W5SBP7_9SPIR|nr:MULTISPECIES: hypothetical protein [Borrelia]AHH04519.1 hypothetical protein BHY_1569 [Borrelia nietonii YOR]AHH14738.1 Immunogenic protein p35 [Borrelia hermsii MTW]UPA09931.1 hypothetical protein bhYOR_001237 [Borrelia nietonii YOR]UPA09980.1 hypothetical protein bhYOR_001302 [Borrelia nietonii YOR]